MHFCWEFTQQKEGCKKLTDDSFGLPSDPCDVALTKSPKLLDVIPSNAYRQPMEPLEKPKKEEERPPEDYIEKLHRALFEIEKATG